MIDLDPATPDLVRDLPPIEAVVYAGFWIRTWASLIDSLLLLLVIVPLTWFVFGSTEVRNRSDLIDFLMTTALPAMIVLIFWARTQATPGKSAVRARIVDARTGGEPGLVQCCVRYLGYYVSAIALGLGFLWIAFDARKQGWHDKMAGTLVVRRTGVPS